MKSLSFLHVACAGVMVLWPERGWEIGEELEGPGLTPRVMISLVDRGLYLFVNREDLAGLLPW